MKKKITVLVFMALAAVEYGSEMAMAETAIPEITQRVLAAERYVYNNVTDINKDGLVNCIDPALMFYEQYGPEAKIIWWIVEHNVSTHLLCAVPNGYGQWLYIETNRYKDSLSSILIQNTNPATCALSTARGLTVSE